MVTALIAKKCLACSKPVESLLKVEVLCNECIAFQVAAGRIPNMKPCPMCDTDIPTARDLCDLCIETLKDSSILKNRRKTDTLKLYKLYVYDPPTGTGVVRKNAVMYVLGKSEPSTVESVQEWLREELGDWSYKTQVTSIKELTGPFEHGHVIYYGETDK